MGAGQYVGSIQTFIITVGQKVGQEAVVLTPVQIPAHTHPITIPPSALSGTVSLPLNSTAISGQTITGSVTVQALNGDSAPTGGVNVPTATANTVGKNGGALQFYPPGTNKVAVPTSHSLAVSGGTVSGTASGPIKLPETAAQLTTGANALSGAPVPLLQPSLGMTQCIVTKGLFPARP
jgi:microcystin-dependent protein